MLNGYFWKANLLLTITGSGHLFLVRRWVLMNDDGNTIYSNRYHPDEFSVSEYSYPLSADRVIRGTSNIGSLRLITEAGIKLSDTLDAYGPGITPQDKNSLDITDIVLAGLYGTLDGAWNAMVLRGHDTNRTTIPSLTSPHNSARRPLPAPPK